MDAMEDHPVSPVEVSVIIPTYNRSAVLRDCVASVLKSDFNPLEVIVVDNASTDDTETVCMRCYGTEMKRGRVHYVRLSENRNAAGGRNAGLTYAKGRYLLFLDSDNVVDPAMVGILVRALDVHPAVGLVAPLSIQARSGVIWTLGADYDFWTSRPINLHENERPETVHMLEAYPTRYSPNAVMVTRAAVDRGQAFDPFYGVMYEEADFGFRITSPMVPGLICPRAKTLHMGAIGNEQALALRRLGIETPERTYCFARNRSVFMRRFAPWYGQLSFFLVFIHVFTIYYCWIAFRNKRSDIAWAYFKGAFRGLYLAFFHMPPLPLAIK